MSRQPFDLEPEEEPAGEQEDLAQRLLNEGGSAGMGGAAAALPYDGNVMEATRRRNRDAIRTIFEHRERQAAAAPPPVDAPAAGPVMCHGATKCSICLLSYLDGENIISLNCNHCFHSDCFNTWRGSRGNDCPVCRQPFKGVSTIVYSDPPVQLDGAEADQKYQFFQAFPDFPTSYREKKFSPQITDIDIYRYFQRWVQNKRLHHRIHNIGDDQKIHCDRHNWNEYRFNEILDPPPEFFNYYVHMLRIPEMKAHIKSLGFPRESLDNIRSFEEYEKTKFCQRCSQGPQFLKAFFPKLQFYESWGTDLNSEKSLNQLQFEQKNIWREHARHMYEMLWRRTARDLAAAGGDIEDLFRPGMGGIGLVKTNGLMTYYKSIMEIAADRTEYTKDQLIMEDLSNLFDVAFESLLKYNKCVDKLNKIIKDLTREQHDVIDGYIYPSHSRLTSFEGFYMPDQNLFYFDGLSFNETLKRLKEMMTLNGIKDVIVNIRVDELQPHTAASDILNGLNLEMDILPDAGSSKSQGLGGEEEEEEEVGFGGGGRIRKKKRKTKKKKLKKSKRKYKRKSKRKSKRK